MKYNIKDSDLEPVYREILYSDSESGVAVSAEDVDHLIDSSTILSLHVAHGENLREALRGLSSQELAYDKALKSIFVVRCSPSYQMVASELTELSRYVNEMMMTADIRWGLAIKSESEIKVTVVAATSY